MGPRRFLACGCLLNDADDADYFACPPNLTLACGVLAEGIEHAFDSSSLRHSPWTDFTSRSGYAAASACVNFFREVRRPRYLGQFWPWQVLRDISESWRLQTMLVVTAPDKRLSPPLSTL